MKKSDILLSIVALVLVGAAIAGMVALYRNIDNAFKTDETTAVTDTNGNVVETEKPVPETTKPSVDTDNSYVSDDFYINEQTQTGYRTIGNITYFFKVIKPVYNPTYQDYNLVVWIENDAVNSYASYEVDLQYSFDSLLWGSCYEDFSWEDYGFQEQLQSNDSVLYVTYTVIPNCSDRSYVLSDLDSNVFFDSNFFTYQVVRGLG